MMADELAEESFDRAKAEAFGQRFLTVLNDGALCLMTSIGHRTGLFDVLREMPPSTSIEIAERAGLDERYVREWLGAMTVSRVLEIDPVTGRYRLPPEHAACLTRLAGSDNIALFTQYVSVLGGVEDDIVECFRHGGGVPYAQYPRFHAVMAEDSALSVLAGLERHILPLVPDLTDRLTSGIRGLDVGCGSGRIVNRLARLFPHSRFTGVDLSPEAIASAREEASREGLSNAEFIVADVGSFDRTAEPESFDLVTTFDAIHDQAKPLNVLQGIHRALRPDGVYLMQDIKGSSRVHENIDHPIGTFLYTISCMHCMSVSLAQGGAGLGAMWGVQKAREYLSRAGFGSVEVHELDHDIQNYWYVVRK